MIHLVLCLTENIFPYTLNYLQLNFISSEVDAPFLNLHLILNYPVKAYSCSSSNKPLTASKATVRIVPVFFIVVLKSDIPKAGLPWKWRDWKGVMFQTLIRNRCIGFRWKENIIKGGVNSEKSRLFIYDLSISFVLWFGIRCVSEKKDNGRDAR